ncbi:hypothetical protein [Massilia pseudoviolaceinigra]|uniref:hypothetical protein n=1 Tax=Massilia pseudoviolaceinigra TaxID=3057165 RepID=UPI002796994D|nr:hypothetical protein [Massilia sp. CCM 9206]MDQ1920961.1 hypothetical protein [Massilia sp. CCM 9206]
MKYVRYTFAGLGLLFVLVWAGQWVFAKENLGSPLAIGLGPIIWGALAAGLLATTWKMRFALAAAGGLGAWALLYGVYLYNLRMFPIP